MKKTILAVLLLCLALTLSVSPALAFKQTSTNFAKARPMKLSRALSLGSYDSVNGLVCKADFNNDFEVNLADFFEFANEYGKSVEDPDFDERYDLDNNKKIGRRDYRMLKAVFGRTCDPSAIEAPVEDLVCQADFNDNGSVELNDYALFANEYGKKASAGNRYDLDKNGVIGNTDTELFIAFYGMTCPSH